MRLFVTIVLAIAIAIASCGSSATTTVNPEPADAAGGVAIIAIESFAFQPSALSVQTGDTVEWTNLDTVGHTVTADDGAFASGTMTNGGTYAHTFTGAGSFLYHCTIHPTMTASITVSG